MFTTPKSPKFTTTRFCCLMQQTFSLERCRKNQCSRSHAAWEAFCFCFSCSMGVRFLLFATPLERECDFFHFGDSRWGGVEKMKKKNRLLAREVLQKAKIALPCCMRSKKKMLPMQHGSAKIDFCNTSRAKTSVASNMKISLL